MVRTIHLAAPLRTDNTAVGCACMRVFIIHVIERVFIINVTERVFIINVTERAVLKHSRAAIPGEL